MDLVNEPMGRRAGARACSERRVAVSVRRTAWARKVVVGVSGLAVVAGVSVLAPPSALAWWRSSNLCIRNDTTKNLVVDWEIFDTKTGEGKLAPGRKLCAEGSFVAEAGDVLGSVKVAGDPASGTRWLVMNLGIGTPYIASTINQPSSRCRLARVGRDASDADRCWLQRMGQRQHRCVQDEGSGLWYRVSREADDSWIQWRVIVTTGC